MTKNIKEVLILSGKGGTGKTSLVGSFAHLAEDKILVDCDVDAADLHLLLSPQVIEKFDFISGVKARVVSEHCSSCGLCEEVCQFEAVHMADTAEISMLNCEGCGVCAYFCPEKAILLDDNHCGSWYIAKTPYGLLVHAQLFAGEENSGKLVSHIKKKARELAESNDTGLILIDGSPGVGCPVIASLSNVDMVVLVTEPSLTGKHDLERILDLAHHFQVPAMVCINKWDIHPEMSDAIEAGCRERDVPILGKIPFDPIVVECQVQGIPVTKSETSPAAFAIRNVWKNLCKRL